MRFTEQSWCDWCAREISPHEPHRSLNQDAVDCSDGLWMHLACLAAWPGLVAYGHRQLEQVRHRAGRSGWKAVVFDDDKAVVVAELDWGQGACSPGTVFCLSVWLGAIDEPIKVPLSEWAAWVTSAEPPSLELADFELVALRQVRARARKALPTRDSVFFAVDWPAKGAIVREERAVEADVRRGEVARHLAARRHWERVAEQIRTVGLTCPHCDGRPQTYRAVEDGLSVPYFVCPDCHRSISPTAEWPPTSPRDLP